MVCSQCGKRIPNDSTFCPACGAQEIRTAVPVAKTGPLKQKTCTACSQLIPWDSIFCPECGAKQAQPAVQEKKPLTPEEKETLKKRGIILGAAAAALVLVCLVVGVLSAVIKPGMNLNSYVTVAFDGYDTIGTARLEFDRQQFAKDHGEKLAELLNRKEQAQQKKNDDLFSGLLGETKARWDAQSAAQRFLRDCVAVSLDTTEQLSNGDMINCLWQCDETMALEQYGYKLKYADSSFAVAGLKTPELFDPFEGINVTFSGISPFGRAQLERNNDYGALSYEMGAWQNLKTGDTVTVHVYGGYGEDLEDFCLRQYQLKPSATTMTFTVEGLDSYLTAAAQIPEETLKTMQSQAEDTFRARVAKEWEGDEEFKDMQYLGNYLLLNKAADAYRNRNLLYLVYEVTVENYFASEHEEDKEPYHRKNKIYWYICYSDLVVCDDGSIQMDITQYSTPNHAFTYDSGLKRNSWSNKVWEYKGYKKLDDLYKDVVTANLEGFTHEENILQEAD